MKRTVEMELLDVLPARHPRALHSRRDLHLLNALMGHAGALSRMIESAASNRTFQNPIRIVEIGAGDGAFALCLARRLQKIFPRAEMTLVDCKPAVSVEIRDEFASLNWKAESIAIDVFDWLQTPSAHSAHIIVANLFLHQFDDASLARLLALIAGCAHLFVACEPRRARLPFVMSRMLGLIGCNDVTCHDAPVSVRAGFAGTEISALWPANGGWLLQENASGFFSHTFLAQQKSMD